MRGISLSIPAGEVLGLLGPNGAGKSTTLKMLATLLRPTGGSARVAGYDLTAAPNEVRKVIGYVPEGAELWARTRPPSILCTAPRSSSCSAGSASSSPAGIWVRRRTAEAAEGLELVSSVG